MMEQTGKTKYLREEREKHKAASKEAKEEKRKARGYRKGDIRKWRDDTKRKTNGGSGGEKRKEGSG